MFEFYFVLTRLDCLWTATVFKLDFFWHTFFTRVNPCYRCRERSFLTVRNKSWLKIKNSQKAADKHSWINLLSLMVIERDHCFSLMYLYLFLYIDLHTYDLHTYVALRKKNLAVAAFLSLFFTYQVCYKLCFQWKTIMNHLKLISCKSV